MRDLLYRVLKRSRSLKKNKEGATAIEFALLAIPFFTLLFAILELAVIFFISATLSHAVGETGRQIRTGNFQNCNDVQFKAAVCANMIGVGNCERRLRIDVVSDTTFSSITLPDAPEPPDPVPGVPTPDIPNGDFVDTAAGVPVIVRGSYYHNLILPPTLTRLENVPGRNVHLITASTAFRNEPFPAIVSTCQ